ncbi:MAG: hypothetical protein MJ077_01510 [Oscillospiraceae bacterium]|nr:hypothetical protein [Oscillospiraceae bacterium]
MIPHFFARRDRSKATYPTEFDTIVSLGFNCEVSFRIRDHLNGHLDSYPYSWCYVYGNADLTHCLDHPEDILSGDIELLPNGMLLCKTCHLSFHGKMPLSQLWNADGSPHQERLDMTIAELRARLSHMQDKLRWLLKDGKKRTLFLMKNGKIAFDSEAATRDILCLSNWLEQHYVGGQYLLVVVVEKPYLTPRLRRLENDHLLFRSVRQFAKEGKAQSGGDHEGWNAIFNEFDPHQYPLHSFSS